MLSEKALMFGQRLAKITMGIDEVYRRELSAPGNIDGLVVVNMGFNEREKFNNYDECREGLRELLPKAFEIEEEDRRLYYTQACISLDSFCAFRQGKLQSLTSQVGMFLHVNPAPVSYEEIERDKKKLRSLLTSMGYLGDLETQMNEWEKKNTVPKDSVKDYMDDLMKIARERTGNILELPENDFYKCKTETNVPYNARSDYENRTVWINIDPILTKQGLKHLVCHECYPGHFMQFTLRRSLYEKGIAAADGLLSVVNHSSSATFEGIADAGIEFIDWVEDDDDRVCAILTNLRSALGTASSYQMHVEKKSDEEVRDWLYKNALTGGEGWIEGRMKFIKDEARAALIWSYWRGDQGTFSVWRNVPKEKRAQYFDYIYGRLHTVQSMQLFK